MLKIKPLQNHYSHTNIKKQNCYKLDQTPAIPVQNVSLISKENIFTKKMHQGTSRSSDPSKDHLSKSPWHS